MNELLEQLRWLLNMYRVIKRHLDEFTKQFRWALTSREMYKWLQITPVETLTDIQRAARFNYLQKLAFGGKVANQNFGTATTTAPRLNLLRLSQTYIEHTLTLYALNKLTGSTKLREKLHISLHRDL